VYACFISPMRATCLYFLIYILMPKHSLLRLHVSWDKSMLNQGYQSCTTWQFSLSHLLKSNFRNCPSYENFVHTCIQLIQAHHCLQLLTETFVDVVNI
jgi:hypothetical protein